MMKLLAAFTFLFFVSTNSFSQIKIPTLDKSPLDVSYFPTDYPLLKVQDKISGLPIARVIYSRPQKNNRVIFGDLIEYGKVWRLGANEATEIEFYQNVKVGNAKIKKGRYSLYAIPSAEKWTVIINRDLDTWGSFKYDATKDVARVDIPVLPQADTTEAFSMYFEKTDKGFILNAVWENVKAAIPIYLQ